MPNNPRKYLYTLFLDLQVCTVLTYRSNNMIAVGFGYSKAYVDSCWFWVFEQILTAIALIFLNFPRPRLTN